jgi:hypothetical protein
MSCPTPQGASPAPCIGLEGLPPYPVFFLDFTGFDVPTKYIGVDRKAMGHVAVEARPQRESPPRPCIGGRRVGNVVVSQWTAIEYRCSKDNNRVERYARHGEGAHVGHLLLEWSQEGTDYIASAHGHTTANLDLLKKLISSMTLIAPGNP